MTQAKVQHYVPRFLLRKFAEKDQVHVFDKKDGRVFRTNIKNVASESRFYDFEMNGNSVSMEPGLSKVEGIAAEIIEQILVKDSLADLTVEERTTLAFFFAIQQVRTPTFRETFRSLPILLRDKLRSQGHTPEQLCAIEEYLQVPDDKELARESAHFIQSSIRDFIPLYLNKDWVLGATTPSRPFFIGDNPIALQNHARPAHAFYGNIGLGVRGIEIYFPLSPTRAIAVWCDSLLGEIRNATNALLNPQFRQSLSPYAREVLAAADCGRPLRYTPENVENFNSLQVAYSERYVFSLDGHFDLAREMLKKQPDLHNGPRMTMA